MNPMELFSSLEQNYKLPQGFLSRLYQIESGGGKNLYNEKSGATGPFQFIPSTAQAMGLKNPNDLAESAEATARLAAQNRSYLQKKGIENVDGPTLFLAHNQGADGAYRLLTNAEKPASDIVGEKAVTWNSGEANQPAGAFVAKIKGMYGEGGEGESSGSAYSALGTSEALDKSADDMYRERRAAGRREEYALSLLMNAAKGLEPQRPNLLPIPRLSYAKGGIVSLVEPADEGQTRLEKTVTETAIRAHGIPPKELARLIRLASGMSVPKERASEFARQIIDQDVNGLAQRFKKYGNAQRTLMRLNAILGGKEHKSFASGGLFNKDAGLEKAKARAQALMSSGDKHPVVRGLMKNLINNIK